MADTIDMGELIIQHRKRIPVKVEINGEPKVIILKHLTKMRAGEVVNIIREEDSNFDEATKEMEYYMDISKYPNMTEEEKEKFERISSYISQYSDKFIIGTFVNPQLKNVEELEALSASMSLDDWDKIISIATVLSKSSLPLNRINTALIQICEKYNIPLSEDLTAENMTVEQFDAFFQATEEDSKEAKKLIGWEPKISLDEGLKKTIKWISENFKQYKVDIYNI